MSAEAKAFPLQDANLFQGRVSACSLQNPCSGNGSSRSLCCSKAFRGSSTALGNQTCESFSKEALSLHWRFWSTDLPSRLLQCHTSSLTQPHDIYYPVHSFLGNFMLIQPQSHYFLLPSTALLYRQDRAALSELSAPAPPPPQGDLSKVTC